MWEKVLLSVCTQFFLDHLISTRRWSLLCDLSVPLLAYSQVPCAVIDRENSSANVSQPSRPRSMFARFLLALAIADRYCDGILSRSDRGIADISNTLTSNIE